MECLDFKKVSRAKAPRAQRSTACHFDRREKSFLDPSHSLGMTDLGPSLGALAFARVILFFVVLTEKKIGALSDVLSPESAPIDFTAE